MANACEHFNGYLLHSTESPHEILFQFIGIGATKNDAHLMSDLGQHRY